MKYGFSSLLCLLFSAGAYAQHETDNWYFGYAASVSFANTNPAVLIGSGMTALSGCSSVSDPSSGQLVAYTNGVSVWDRNNQVMPNGTGLHGNPWAIQNALIAHKPGSANTYYVFTTDGPGYGLEYSELDMTLNNGAGDITSVKNIPVYTPAMKMLTAVSHATAGEYWLITHGYGNNTFAAFHISASGVSNTPVISTLGPVVGNPNDNAGGYLKASPDCRRLAMLTANPTCDIFRFDPATGVVFDPISVPIESNPFSLGFAPDSKLLYVYLEDQSDPAFTCFVYQYNLVAGTGQGIANSRVEIASTIKSIGDFKTGRDGKVYVSHASSKYLSAIGSPDLPGTACNYDAQAVFLGAGTSAYGLPNNLVSCYSESGPSFPPPDDCFEQVPNDSIFPNIFTPNGDGINDYLTPRINIGLNDIEVLIYDRWGRKVHAGNNVSIYWEAFDMQGDAVTDGVYYWIVRGTSQCSPGSKVERHGFVHVIR